MVNLKTKSDKHANDNEKRRRSIKEKEKLKLNQSQIIKQALSNNTLSSSSSKKIIFNQDDDENEIADTSSKRKIINENGKTLLFDSSDGETEDLEIKEKSQFRGKKGFELLNLQSTYGNDERFRIDSRFLEDEEEEFVKEDNDSTNVTDGAVEKAKQLKILEDILGTPIVTKDREKKVNKKTTEMVRYDASNKDHQIYEINNQTETAKPTPSKKRKEGKKIPKTDKHELPTPKVSKEKFYEVSNEIKNRFREKNEDGGQFSLLQTYGLNGAEKSSETEEEEAEEEAVKDDGFDKYIEKDKKEDEWNGDYGTEDMRVTEEPKEKETVTLAKGIWKESFFFDHDDPRFKEGLEFINKKNSEEAKEAAENYNQTRKKLKEILRLHLKKQMHKKDPFRNKIGGMSKKQLNSFKSKNPKMASTKRKPQKMNPGGRI